LGMSGVVAMVLEPPGSLDAQGKNLSRSGPASAGASRLTM
jgi:hypothetical protein